MKLIALRSGKYYTVISWPFIIVYWYITCRGYSFRRSFSRLGEIRSIVPASINVMALTATASKATVKIILRTLGMRRNVHTISVNPSKANV